MKSHDAKENKNNNMQDIIADFNKKFVALKNANHQFALSLLALCIAPKMTDWSLTAFMTSLGAVSTMFNKRNHARNEYKQKLDALAYLYINLAKQGPRMTQHPEFLLLLDILAPLLWVDTLYPKEFRTMAAQSLLSKEYKDKLALEHQVIFPEVSNITTVSQNKDSVQPVLSPSQESKKIEKQQVYHFMQNGIGLFYIFKKPIMELRRWCYGYGTHDLMEEELKIYKP